MATIQDALIEMILPSGFGESATGAARVFKRWVRYFAKMIKAAINRVLALPPSPGYEPYLIERGVSLVLARPVATLWVRMGKRRAREAKSIRPVHDAIRFLASPNRQARSLITRAKLLLTAATETSIVDEAFGEARQLEDEFIGLLNRVVQGGDIDRRRIAEIATEISPKLSISRGPKVTAPSAAHELALTDLQKLNLKGFRTRHEQYAEYVDPLTEATRREFGRPNFDSRPVRRRNKRRALSSRQKSGAP